ncbi:MAG: hypothetical protein MJZ61_04485 [Bacteroidales bacterium]|nr:hypothetical protein [Bacteroidales bacterium]
MAASKKTPKRKRTEEEKEAFLRQHRQSFRLNDMEMKALLKYYKKYKVRNRARFLRETIMTAVLKKFDEDYPTLFEVPEPAKPTNAPVVMQTLFDVPVVDPQNRKTK